MRNQLKLLKNSDIKKLPSGKHPTGIVSGLYIFKNTNGNASFVLRYMSPTLLKRREFDLGGINDLSIQEACEKAIEYKKLVSNGIDPIEYRSNKKLQTQNTPSHQLITFHQVAMEWFDARSRGGVFPSLKAEKEALGILKKYIFPVIGGLDVENIGANEIKNCLEPIWTKKHHTAEKVKSQIGKILRWASATGQRKRTDSPTDLKSSLGILLEPYKNRIPEEKHFAKCPVSQIPALMKELHNHPFSMSARAVEFTILTASRSQAVRKATWDEFDLSKGIWNVNPQNDKIKTSNRNRTIYLSKQAINLLKSLPRYFESPYVFTKASGGTLGNDAFRMFIVGLHERKLTKDGIGWVDDEIIENGKPKRITLHGTARSSFKTWSKDDSLGNNRRFDSEAVEMCLLHQRDDEYKGAYDRSTLEKERRFGWNFTQNGTALLTTWDMHFLIKWDSYLRRQPYSQSTRARCPS